MALSVSGSSPRGNGISGEVGPRRALKLAALPLAMLAALPLPAAALYNDRVEVFAAENVTYDSNVFRLSDKLEPSAIGASGRSDTSSVTSVGATLDLPYSLQRFQANLTWFATRYHRFTNLDFNGHTGRAAWLWSVTPHLTGDVGYTDTETLANYANLLNTAGKDVLRIKQAFGNAVWFPVASWRIHGGAAAVEQRHSDPTQQIRDIDTATGVAGVSYVTANDDRLGIEGRTEDGRSPHDQFRTTGNQTGYKQHSLGIVGHWVATGHSILDGRVDYVRRDYDNPSVPDFSGPTFRAAHTWTPTGKITVVTSLYRDIGPIADVQSPALVIVKGVSVKPAWAATDKITLSGDVEYNVWDYRTDVVTGLAYTNRVRTFGAALAYKPTQKILIQGVLSHEVRTSTLALADYKDDIASITARIGF